MPTPKYILEIGKYACYPEDIPRIRPLGEFIMVSFEMPDGVHTVITKERVESIISAEGIMEQEKKAMEASMPPRVIIPEGSIQ